MGIDSTQNQNQNPRLLADRCGFVILSYNHPGITDAAVESVLKLGVDPGRIWLVHNGSESRFVESLQGRFSRIHHLILTNNLGFSGGANQGLQRVFEQWEWAIFLSNDCRLMNLPQIPTEPSLVGPHVLIRDTGKTDSLGGRVDLNRARIRHFRTPAEFEAADSCRFINGAAFMIHRKVFSRVGGFDESYGTYWEDVKLSRLALQMGFRLSIQPNWQVRHGVGKTCHSSSLYTLFYYQRNRKRLCWDELGKWYRPQTLGWLAWDWIRMALNLVRRKRFLDLRLLAKAILGGQLP